MNALVIYDGTGKIWNIIYGASEEDRPIGIPNMFVDIPDGAILERIDVSDPANHRPVYTYMPESDIGRLMKEVKELSSTDLKNREDLSLAITDLYELVLGLYNIVEDNGDFIVSDTSVENDDSAVESEELEDNPA